MLSGLGMTFDERSWFGDPGTSVRKKRMRESTVAFAARVNGARPFPVAAAKILTLTAGDSFDVRAIVEILETDAPTTARVLRLVNSPAFGLRTRCSSVGHAVPMIGASGVRTAAVAGAMLEMFPASTTVWRDLHAHAMIAAGIARQLAPDWRLPADEMFTTAFLHDIGKWILLEHEQGYAEVLTTHGGACEGTLDEEHGRFGFDHAELSEHMLTAWCIPQPIPRVVGMHHDPGAAYVKSGQLGVRVALLRLSNLLAHAITSGSAPDFDALAATEPISYLGLSAQSLRERYPFLVRLDEQAHDEGGTEGTSARAVELDAERDAERDGGRESRSEDVCTYCDSAWFGVRCTRCGARLCTEHTPPHGKLCLTCEEAFAARPRHATLSTARVALGVAGASTLALAASTAWGHLEWAALFCATLSLGAGAWLARRRWASRRAFLGR